MSACPNINTIEWKLLEAAVGRNEAMRDWMENDQEIRNPEIVKAKLEMRKTPMIVEAKSKYGPIETELLKSKAIQWKNDTLFVNKFRHPAAVNAVAAINKVYGPGTARILPVKSVKGGGGRTIFKIEVNTPIQEVEETKPKQVNEQTSMFMREWAPIELDTNTLNNTAAIEMADKISKALGVSYEIVDAAKALSIEPEYKNEIGFYKDGKVYFVGENLRPEVVFHEFSHPFVRSISQNNSKLFDSLYARILASPEAAAIIEEMKKNYSKLTKGSDPYKEEVFVRALTLQALNKLKGVKPSKGFASVIKDILYAIKQLLRKLFGQTVKVEKLDVNTGLQDLADILVKGEKLKLDVKPLTKGDVTAYLKHTLEDLEEIKTIKDERMIKMINLLSSRTFKWFKKLEEDKRYSAPAEAIGVNRSEFEQVIEILSNYKSTKNEEQFKKKLKLLEEKVGRRDQQASALMNSLYLVKNSAKKINDHLKKLTQDVDNEDNVSQMIYYKHYIDDWITNTDNMLAILKDQKIDSSNRYL